MGVITRIRSLRVSTPKHNPKAKWRQPEKATNGTDEDEEEDTEEDAQRQTKKISANGELITESEIVYRYIDHNH